MEITLCQSFPTFYFVSERGIIYTPSDLYLWQNGERNASLLSTFNTKMTNELDTILYITILYIFRSISLILQTSHRMLKKRNHIRNIIASETEKKGYICNCLHLCSNKLNIKPFYRLLLRKMEALKKIKNSFFPKDVSYLRSILFKDREEEEEKNMSSSRISVSW